MVDVPKKVCYNSLVPGSISVAGHDILLRLVLVPAHAATLDKNLKIFMGILPSEVFDLRHKQPLKFGSKFWM